MNQGGNAIAELTYSSSTRGSMATIESCRYTFAQIVQARAFRTARCYAPPTVTGVLGDVVDVDELILIVDIDTLERSALARIDRVMLLALDSLAHAGVEVVLFSRDEWERAMLLQKGITGARCIGPSPASIGDLRDARPDARIVVLSDDPFLLTGLADGDRGIALGRPELVSERVATMGDTSVRATLWWMLTERERALCA